MTNPEITTNFEGEIVAYKDWLRKPVFEASWWSPTGTHVEALVQIGRGEDVSNEVIQTFRDEPDLIDIWNELSLERKENAKEIMIRRLMTRIINEYQNNDTRNAIFEQICPSGKTAIDSKGEILRRAVQLRSFQLAQDPGFQGA